MRGGCRAVVGWMGRLGLRRLSGRVDGLDWLIVGAAALGAALVMARVLPYGVGLTHDSMYYIEAARNVTAGAGFVNTDGSIYTTWPPGYPILLAIAGLGVVDPHSAAGALNAVLFGLTIFAAGHYLRGRLETRVLALWACVAIALALPLADLARFAMPDMPFIAFATLALIQTDRALRDGKRSALVWAAVLCAAAWQTRWIGVVVPAVAGMAPLLQGGMPLSRRMRRAALFGAIAGAPMALWLLRNYIATGGLPGAGGVGFSLTDTLRDGARIMAGWGQPLSGWPAVIVLAVLVIGLGVFFARGRGARGRRACLIFGGFALAYVALLSAVLMLGSAWGGVRPRYVAVLYIPLVVIAAFALDGLFCWARDRQAAGSAGGLTVISVFTRGRLANRLAVVALVAGLCAWIAVQAVDNADHIARANSGELTLGRAGPGWAENETMRYLRENLSGAVIHTNVPHTANFLSGGNADYRDLKHIVPSRDEFMRWAAINEGAYVVWIDYHEDKREFRLINMRVREGLEPIAKFADGEVFLVNSEYKPTPDDNPYFNAYSAVARGEAERLSAGAEFDIYIHQDTLVYFKNPCVVADTRERFFLHIFPDDASDLPDARKGNGFENLDFDFTQRGALFEGNCVVPLPLPRYEYERIRAGQYVIGGGALWDVDVVVSAARRYRQAYKAAIAGEYGGAAARSNFDIYLDDNAESKALIYVKEPCAPEDTRARFFLHVFPDDAADLPADGARYGFENLDFRFAEYGANLGGICVATRELPEYEVERIHTGQYVSGEGALWKADVAVSAGRAYRQAYNAASAGEYGGAAARSSFDVYLDDAAENRALIYVKERCEEADTQARFFLHIVPEDAADLADERKASGFENLDFGLAEYGADLGEVCVAVRELPGYGVGRVRTGQYVSGEGALWRVEFGVDGGE